MPEMSTKFVPKHKGAKNAISHRGNALAKMLEYLTIVHPNA